MIKNYYTPSNYTSNKTDYTKFGGIIYNYDFDGYTSISDIASRIESDRKFDEKCRKNIEQGNKQSVHKNNRKFKNT